MINLDSIWNENKKENNEKWPFIPDHSCKILTIGGSGSRKTNALLNLVSQQGDTDKIYLYVKDLSQPKCVFLIKKCKNVGIKHLNDSNAFTECSNTMNDHYNSNRQRKTLITFDDIIADIVSNKKFQAIVAELFIRCRKLNISLAFVSVLFFYSKRC